MAPPKCLLSDVGGVLVERRWQRAANLLSQESGVDASLIERELRRLSELLDRGTVTFERFYRDLTEAAELSVGRAEFRQIVVKDSTVPQFENIELYRDLRKRLKFRLIAVSNISEEIWNYMYAALDFAEIFDGHVLSFQCHSLKPEGKIYELALREAHSRAQDCLFIDDTLANLSAARSMGIPGILVSRGTELRSQLLPILRSA